MLDYYKSALCTRLLCIRSKRSWATFSLCSASVLFRKNSFLLKKREGKWHSEGQWFHHQAKLACVLIMLTCLKLCLGYLLLRLSWVVFVSLAIGHATSVWKAQLSFRALFDHFFLVYFCLNVTCSLEHESTDVLCTDHSLCLCFLHLSWLRVCNDVSYHLPLLLESAAEVSSSPDYMGPSCLAIRLSGVPLSSLTSLPGEVNPVWRQLQLP